MVITVPVRKPFRMPVAKSTMPFPLSQCATIMALATRKTARILLELKQANGIVPNLAFLQEKYGVSRRTLQRARAKLARLGLIEHVSWMNSRYGGQSGWRLSGKMSTALRQLADKMDQWRRDTRPERMEKDEMLVGGMG
jgi:predicted transcriptional regulator